MNIYLISQNINTGYDTCDSAVVIAENEDKAREIMNFDEEYCDFGTWVKRSQKDSIIVEHLGSSTKTEPEIILVSFNAG
jgi:hypothetical protein